MDAYNPADPIVFKFGRFELIPAMRLLAADGQIIKIGSRAFDLLTVLVERAGAIVAKTELMERVWRSIVVEDTNLRVHISTLRCLLGDDGVYSRYIVHAARRGYVFVAPVVIERRTMSSHAPTVGKTTPVARAMAG